jgi:hypothetical protein
MKGDIAYVKLPRDLLESYSWHSLSINVRRFIDFLMIEQMRAAAVKQTEHYWRRIISSPTSLASAAV